MAKKEETKACVDCGVTGESETLMQIEAAGKKSEWFCQTCMNKRFKGIHQAVKDDLKIKFAAIEKYAIGNKSIEGVVKQVVVVKMTFLKNEQAPGTLEKLAAQLVKGNGLLLSVGAMQLDMNIDKQKATAGKEDF